MWRIIAVLALAQIGAATVIDLGDYIIDTGSIEVWPDIAVNTTNETSGKYLAAAAFGEGPARTTLALYGDRKIEEKPAGSTKVSKPYPGYLLINNTSGKIYYWGQAKDLVMTAVFNDHRTAEEILDQLQVTPRDEYLNKMSGDLVSHLS